ncbi:MAG TPA: hypothetical protein PKV72_04390 [Candidatus Peribacteria bacterium]|nr:hypothetical protein [Candidatus Peribacteria bacterium]
MHLELFLSKLAGMTRFPDKVLADAAAAGRKIDDTRRGVLMTALEKEYAGYVAADDARKQRQIEMTAEVVAFKKENLPKLQKAAEAAEHETTDQSFDQLFAEAAG